MLIGGRGPAVRDNSMSASEEHTHALTQKQKHAYMYSVEETVGQTAYRKHFNNSWSFSVIMSMDTIYTITTDVLSTKV